MNSRISQGWSSFLFPLVGISLAWMCNSSFAFTGITSGLNAPVGVALDEDHNHLYFVEYSAATNNLKRLILTPDCENGIVACTVQSIPVALGHPEDVALDLPRGHAYVTTRDDPGSGGLWRIDITSGIKQLITFNLGAPQQLILDMANNAAYTVGYDDGRLRRIDLTTGVKTPLFIGLDHPVGLAVTADGHYAYVTEQGTANRITKIDLSLGTRVSGADVTGLISPFFLAWADPSETALYVTERNPVNRLIRADLLTASRTKVEISLPAQTSGLALRGVAGPVFLSSNHQIFKVDLMFPYDPTLIFTQVGHVPSTSIEDGYATTDSTYFFRVKDAPFGGTINLFGNLSKFKASGATHYEVQVSKDGGKFTALNQAWTAYKWNPDPAVLKFQPVTLAPEPGTTKYPIPQEYPSLAHWWVPPFQMMRWPSGENGDYTFRVAIYEYDSMSASYIDRTPGLAGDNSLMLKVDNTPPDAEILRICQKVCGAVPTNDPCFDLGRHRIAPCEIVTAPDDDFRFVIRAYDPNGHLRYYRLRALWGDNQAQDIISPIERYADHVNADGPRLWYGEINTAVPEGSSWTPATNCAYTFYLTAAKRTINGYNYLLWDHYHQSVSIDNQGSSCP